MSDSGDETLPSAVETPVYDGAVAGGAGGGPTTVGPGATIGRYKIREVVGAGGAGVVLSAQDTELGRRVAIKILVRDHAEARARLVREAQAMAKLSHPNVVTVHEILRVGDGTGIVMELVDGVNLGAWRRAASRSWREIVDVYTQAAHGLAAAHRVGLVHRDFKPANALIDKDGVVRVTDFGLVRGAGDGEAMAGAGDDGGAGDVALTRPGTLLGTPAYMAPEQHAGEPLDARTDQWALACSLYDALFGERPFAGDSLAAIAASVLAGAIREEPRDTRVPRHVRAAIRKALSRKPDDRFTNVDDFVAAIAPKRRGVWVAAGAGVIGVAVAAVVIVMATRPVAEGATCNGLGEPFVATWSAERAAALTARFTSVGGSRAPGIASRVVGALDQYRDAWVAARTHACVDARKGVSSAERLDGRERCLEQRRIEVDTIVGAWLTADKDAIEQAVDVTGRLRAVAECDDPHPTMPLPQDPAKRAEIARAEDELSRAWALGEIGFFDRAMPLTTDAVAIAEKTGWTPLVGRALVQHGRSLSHAGKGTEALAAFDRAATAAAQAHDDEVVADALVSRAWELADSLGKPAEALAERSYVELALERAGNPPRLRANYLHHLAAAHYWMRENDEAVATEQESLAILRKTVAPDNIAIMDGIANLSVYEGARNHVDEAVKLLQQRLDYDIAQRGPDHPEVATDYGNLGNLEMHRGDMVAAEARFSHAFDIVRRTGFDGWAIGTSLCVARYQLGRWSAMSEPCTLGLAWAESVAPGDSIPVMVGTYKLATALAALGELDRAAEVVGRSLVAARATKTPEITDVAGIAALIALARGDKAAARRLLAETSPIDLPEAIWLPLAQGEMARRDRDCTTARAAYERTIERCAPEAAEMSITLATIGIAECQIASGHARDAVPALEARVKRLEQVGAEPAAMVAVRAALARALDAR